LPLVYFGDDERLVCQNLQCDGGLAGGSGSRSLSDYGLSDGLSILLYLCDSDRVSDDGSGGGDFGSGECFESFEWWIVGDRIAVCLESILAVCVAVLYERVVVRYS
jgi:hypothetical protein